LPVIAWAWIIANCFNCCLFIVFTLVKFSFYRLFAADM
jgi:hypothetical protein